MALPTWQSLSLPHRLKHPFVFLQEKFEKLRRCRPTPPSNNPVAHTVVGAAAAAAAAAVGATATVGAAGAGAAAVVGAGVGAGERPQCRLFRRDW